MAFFFYLQFPLNFIKRPGRSCQFEDDIPVLSTREFWAGLRDLTKMVFKGKMLEYLDAKTQSTGRISYRNIKYSLFHIQIDSFLWISFVYRNSVINFMLLSTEWHNNIHCCSYKIKIYEFCLTTSGSELMHWWIIYILKFHTLNIFWDFWTVWF